MTTAPSPPATPRAVGVDVSSVLICSVIWGTTWFAITLQFGTVPQAWSIAYRFGLAALCLVGWCLITREKIGLTRRQHINALGQGLLTFALDYSLVYAAETRVVSGVVAVLFASLALFNLIVFRLLLGRRASLLAWGGALLGVLGVAVLSWSELSRAGMQTSALVGVGFALAAVLAGALGNIFAFRQEAAGAPVASSTAWAMGYGAAMLAAWALATGQPIGFDLRPSYVASLVYLALFGSVVAFIIYYALARRRSYTFASYISALTPPTAMLVSTLLEGHRWGVSAFFGLALVLAGQVLLIRAPRT